MDAFMLVLDVSRKASAHVESCEKEVKKREENIEKIKHKLEYLKLLIRHKEHHLTGTLRGICMHPDCPWRGQYDLDTLKASIEEDKAKGKKYKANLPHQHEKSKVAQLELKAAHLAATAISNAAAAKHLAV